ncbi:MAG: Holliday junction resolvase RuvX [Fibrobacterales bacterium]
MEERYLGIDFGERRIGLAVGYKEMTIAFPRDTLDTQRVSNIFEAIDAFITEERLEAIVIGYPERTDGKFTDKTVKVDAFIEKLKESLSKSYPIYKQNEAYSTVIAQEKTKHYSKKKKKNQKGKIDSAAAAVILQEFFNTSL